MYIFISIIDKRNAFGVRQMSLQASGQANELVLIPPQIRFSSRERGLSAKSRHRYEVNRHPIILSGKIT